MRLLTHNTLRNNATASKGRGWPLEITATEIRVDDSGDVGEDAERESAFIKGVLGVIDWPTLVQVGDHPFLDVFEQIVIS
mmetsp:Transcript_58762/g.174851  ORF Transcript_58762/g.174851 Transcript_58762/m.174851 type:complete len:80 (+) Transcript_58762:258-497(+)